MLVWLSVWSEVQTCMWPSRCHCHSLSLASVKSRLVSPFWYRLTRVVPDKGPLNGCVCVCMCVCVCVCVGGPSFHHDKRFLQNAKSSLLTVTGVIKQEAIPQRDRAMHCQSKSCQLLHELTNVGTNCTANSQ